MQCFPCKWNLFIYIRPLQRSHYKSASVQWDFTSLASTLELLQSISSCWKTYKITFFFLVHIRAELLRCIEMACVIRCCMCTTVFFFQERWRARSADQTFGHTPAGSQIEDLQIIKSGTCPTEATQSCTNCACARISLCVHGFLSAYWGKAFSVAIVYPGV